MKPGIQTPWRNKVCIFTETYYPEIGGGEKQAQSLAEALTARGYRVLILTRRSHPSLKVAEQVGEISVHRLPPVGGAHPKKWGLLLTSLPTLFRLRHQFDLVFVSGFRILGVPAVVMSKIFGKICILKADSAGEMSGEFFSDGLKKVGLDRFWFLFKIFLSIRNVVLRMADAFIAVSSDIASELMAHGVPEKSIHRIPNSVNTDIFGPVSPGAKQKLRQKFNLSREEKVVIFTGRLVSYKGLPLLLDVWKELCRDHDRLRFLLVGSGGLDIHNCETELRDFVKRNGLGHSVSFIGEVRNVHEYLQASDIFVFPTASEAFGISLIEAMACGLPVIATPLGAARDILRHEINGLIVKPGHLQELHTALDRLLGDTSFSEFLGKNAWRTVHDGYTTEVIAQKHLQLFSDLFTDFCSAGLTSDSVLLSEAENLEVK